jgi:phage-related protein
MQQELTTILSTKLDSKALSNIDKLKQGLEQVQQKAKVFALGAAAIGTSLVTMAKLAGDNAIKLQKLSENSGVSAEGLQEIEYACKSVGVSFEAVGGDLAKLQGELKNPVPGKFNEGLYKLGISTRDSNGHLKDSMQVLTEVSTKLSKMSAQKALDYGKKIGISEDTVKLLMKGKEGIETLRKEGASIGAVVPSKAVNGLATFSKTMSQLGMIGRSIANTFLGYLAPSLQKVVDAFKKWSQSSNGIIGQGLQVFAKIIGKAFEFVAKVIGVCATVVGKVSEKFGFLSRYFAPILKFLDRSGMLSKVVITLLGVLAVSKIPALVQGIKTMAMAMKALAANPITLIIFGLIIAIEELYTWFNKGFEATGFYKLWKVFEKKCPAVANIIKTAVSAIIEYSTAAYEGLKNIFSGIADFVNSAIDTISNAFNTILESVGSVFSKIQEYADKFSGFLSKIASPFKSLFGSTEVKQAVEVTTQNTQQVPSNNTTNTTNNTTNNNQKVNGTTNVYINSTGTGTQQALQQVKNTYGNSVNVISPGMSSPNVQ